MEHTPQTSVNNTSLDASVKDGISYAVMMGSGESYLGPFGIFMGASTLQVGLLDTLPQLFSAIMQYTGARIMPRFKSRRAVVISAVLIQALLWLPIALLPFVLGLGKMPVYFLIGFIICYRGVNGLAIPIWSSLIGDLVPSDIRGRFFGNRNRLTGISTFIAQMCAGMALHVFEMHHITKAGFLMIFGVAFAARVNSARWLVKHDDPAFIIRPDQDFSFWQFLKRSRYSNFAKFVFYVGAINLGVAFSAPYFALYMLRDLQFTYMEFTGITAAATIAQFLTFRYWGDISDRFGNKKILNICGWGIALVPMLWLISSNMAFLVLIQFYAGFVWAGFNLASSNFIFDAVTPPKRALCVAYQSLINGFCLFAGSLCGGYVATILSKSHHMGTFVWNPISVFPAIFFISGVLRLISSLLLLHRFNEVRPVSAIGDRELIFRITHLRPIAGATFSVFTGLFDRRKGERKGKDARQSKKEGDRHGR